MAENDAVKLRFWNKVRKTDGCWEWTASKNPAGPFGYGDFGFRGKVWRAHRVSWTLNVGEIPNGLQVLHKCDNPGCVNPDHLYLGTVSDNMRDRDERKRGKWKRGKDHWRFKRPEEWAARNENLRGPNNGSRRYPERLKRGEENSHATLTEAKVIAIRTKYAAGARQVDLANEFHTDQTNISAIVRRTAWKHVK